MDDILKDFLVETGEHIEAAGTQLVLLERDPSDHDMIASVFRLVHTIKGTCGFLGLVRLAKISHAAEGLIGCLREGAIATADMITLILGAIDRIKTILAHIEQTGEEPVGDDADLVNDLLAHVRLIQNAQPAHVAPNTAPSATEAPVRSSGEKKAEERKTDLPTPRKIAVLSEQADNARPRKPDTIRVTVEALEVLMLLVSELVLTRNQLTEVTRSSTDDAVKGALQRLSAVATDLQDAVMRARMQPMGRIFSTLPRLVRELAVDLGKKIDLLMEGSETELDRQLIELIRAPLTHMIRNCADHGLEPTDVRTKNGKPATGTIRVSAAHEAGQIIIEVVDDGRGLDVDRIKEKAIALGLVTRQEIATLKNNELYRFMFAPGFSTASAVTDISGRGVGLDVVRENIEAIGGSVSVASTPGMGTRFSIRIPLTLAIAPALIVSAGGHRFALPQLGVIEVVSVGAETPHRIENVQGALILRLRGEVLPIADLANLLELNDLLCDPEEERLIIVMRVAAASFGVIVHSVDDMQEIVVKPLSTQLAHIKVFSGQTILGDGSVVLILDSGGIASTLGLERTNQYRLASPQPPATPRETRARVILLRAGPGACKALPLSMITRIESIDAAQIVTTSQGYVIRHRGQLMPLLPAAEGVTPSCANQPVLVIGVGGEAMGLLVDEIIDIVEDPLDIQISNNAPGILGSAEFGGVITEFLDLAYFMRLARPDSVSRGVNKKFRILLVDDRLFFREMLAPVLSAAGYNVITRETAREALALMEKDDVIDAVITDTDMPGMDGYTFARAIRQAPHCAKTPIIALAAQANDKTLATAHLCGINAVVGKFDRRMLLDALSSALENTGWPSQRLEDRILAEPAA